MASRSASARRVQTRRCGVAGRPRIPRRAALMARAWFGSAPSSGRRRPRASSPALLPRRRAPPRRRRRSVPARSGGRARRRGRCSRRAARRTWPWPEGSPREVRKKVVQETAAAMDRPQQDREGPGSGVMISGASSPSSRDLTNGREAGREGVAPAALTAATAWISLMIRVCRLLAILQPSLPSRS